MIPAPAGCSSSPAPVRGCLGDAGPWRLLKLRGGQEADEETETVAGRGDERLHAEVSMYVAFALSTCGGEVPDFIQSAAQHVLGFCPRGFGNPRFIDDFEIRFASIDSSVMGRVNGTTFHLRQNHTG